MGLVSNVRNDTGPQASACGGVGVLRISRTTRGNWRPPAAELSNFRPGGRHVLIITILSLTLGWTRSPSAAGRPGGLSPCATPRVGQPGAPLCAYYPHVVQWHPTGVSPRRRPPRAAPAQGTPRQPAISTMISSLHTYSPKDPPRDPARPGNPSSLGDVSVRLPVAIYLSGERIEHTRRHDDGPRPWFQVVISTAIGSEDSPGAGPTDAGDGAPPIGVWPVGVIPGSL